MHLRTWSVASLAAIVLLGCGVSRSFADPPKKEEGKTAKPATDLPMGNLDTADWLKFPAKKLDPGEIDRMVNAALKEAKLTAAPLTTDEQFIRRVYLDLTGKLPVPADITEFAANKSPDKRAQLIDKLLASDDYARHFGKYWREVFGGARIVDFRSRLFMGHFERWLVEQFKANKSWGQITKDMLTASGELKNAEADKNGQLFFLTSRKGADAVTEIAAETSRIFMGIQIQCAQCHDHPSDVWKRANFHEFAAYFARMRERPIFEEKRIIGSSLVSLPFGEHKMPGADDPKKSTSMSPRFLDGKSPPRASFKFGDSERRGSLADSIVSKSNPWFAGAMTNRMWGLLMGQSFVAPIDDMGPMKDVMMPDVLARIAASFRASDYDIKGLLKDIMTSETYQRQVRAGDSVDSHVLFAGTSPTRMNADELWNSLVGALGSLSGGGGGKGGFGKGGFPPKGGFGGFGLEGQFRAEFGYDPSTKAEDVEGSIAQALLFMNNPLLASKIEAKGTNVLARILSSHKDDDEALRMLYLRTLARNPTDRELDRCRTHIRKVANRTEAFEDILWALLNSTEFQTRR